MIIFLGSGFIDCIMTVVALIGSGMLLFIPHSLEKWILFFAFIS